MALNYLTVQDILWINLHVTGSPQEFQYADLEEAVYYQYGYGSSTNVVDQAGNFLGGFLKKKPLAAGNEATAFIACIAFLKANNVEVKLEDPVAWFKAIENGTCLAADSVRASSHEGHAHHAVSVREAIESVARQYADTVDAIVPVAA